MLNISDGISDTEFDDLMHQEERGDSGFVEGVFEIGLTDEEFSSELLDTIKTTNGMRTIWSHMPEVKIYLNQLLEHCIV